MRQPERKGPFPKNEKRERENAKGGTLCRHHLIFSPWVDAFVKCCRCLIEDHLALLAFSTAACISQKEAAFSLFLIYSLRFSWSWDFL